MAKARSDQLLVPSILDRLLDDQPDVSREAPRPRHQVVAELRQSIRRDLEHLLNTRWRCTAWPPSLDELEVSLVNYGIPDFTGANLGSSAERERFRRIVETTLRRFEPRFKTVRVRLVDDDDRLDRVLHFRIDAVVDADPAPEAVVFDTSLEPTSGSFVIDGGGR
jgi:type VI secretion system protein ImpF